MTAAIAAIVTLCAPAGAEAATTQNFVGTWDATGTNGMAHQLFKITSMDTGSGAFSGQATYPNGSVFSPLNGTASGSSFTLVTPYPGGYTATFVGSVSGDTMTGTWSDTHALAGNFTATRTSGSGGGGGSNPGAKQATTTQVHCNYLVATGLDTCYAQVGGGSPGADGIAPTGTVKFASANGGVFIAGNSCVLVKTPNSSNVSSCSVEFLPPTSSFPKVGAAYEGDANYAGSIGTTTFLILGGLPGGIGIDLGSNPAFGSKTSSPVTVGCSASASKSAKVQAALTVSAECLAQMRAEYEAQKNAFIGKPCDDPVKSYQDLKDCNPRYHEALEQWEREHNIDEETEKLEGMIKLRSDLFEELKAIIDEYNKNAKQIINGAKQSSLGAQSSRSKALVLGASHVRVKSGKQKQMRIKLTKKARKLLSYPRRLNKLLPGLRLQVNVKLKVTVTAPSSKKKGKPKRKTTTRTVPFGVTP